MEGEGGIRVFINKDICKFNDNAGAYSANWTKFNTLE